MSDEAKTVEFTGVEAAIEAMRESGVPIISDEMLGDRVALGPEVQIRDVSPSKKALTVVFSTSKYCERDGCLLESKGVSLKNFKRNPVVLWMHDYRELPIATSKSVRFVDEDGGQLVGKPVFHGKTELSAEVWALIEMGVLKAWSLGFIPTHVKRLDPKEVGLKVPSEEDKDKYKSGEGVIDLRSFDPYWRIVKSELLEYSSVTVPADANALSKAIRSLHEGGRSVPQIERQLRASGMDIPELVPAPIKIESREDAEEAARAGTSLQIDVGEDRTEEIETDEMHRPEETEDYIHVPVRDAGDFIDETFRTIAISKKEGIDAVAGKLKKDGDDGPMTVQKYVFEKAKGWTMKKAQKWVDSHKKALEDWIVRMLDAGLDLDCFEFERGDGYVPMPIADDAFRVGKVLSKKTAGLIQDAREKCVAASDALDGVLKSAEKQEEQIEETVEKKVEPEKAPARKRRTRVRGDALRGLVKATVGEVVSAE
jgi:phage head maturation protease